MNELDNKPLLGIRQWHLEKDGYLHSLFYDGVWQPKEDMAAGEHVLEPYTSRVPVEFRTINMHDHYLSVADERERMGYPMSAMRNRLKAKIMEEQGAWHVAYEAVRWEDVTHYPGFIHEAPADYCTCGLYANYVHRNPPPPGHLGVGRTFTGAVAAWGEIILHDRGFRAQNMRIVALFDHPRHSREVLSNLADRCGVPVIDPEEVELFALAENYQIYRGEPSGEAEDKRGFWK